MDIMIWLFAASVAGFSIFIVFLFMYYINPARNSPAIYFIEGKRKNKPVAAIDEGSFWKGIIATNTDDDDYIRDKKDNQIETMPGAMKYWRGVMFGVGEGMRSRMANVAVVDLITEFMNRGVTQEQLQNAMRLIDIKKTGGENENKGKVEEEPAGPGPEPAEQPEQPTEPANAKKRGRPRAVRSGELLEPEGLPEVREPDGITPETEEDG